MSIKLGKEHLPLLEKLWETLLTEKDPVKQQIAIELLTARHVARMEDKAEFVMDSIRKHVLQMLGIK